MSEYSYSGIGHTGKILIIVAIILFIYIYNKNKVSNFEPFQLDKIVYEPKPDPQENIKFNYENESDKRFLLEQDNSVNLATRYPNTWIQSIDENGDPVYANREMVTGKPDIIVEEKVRNSWEFNKPKVNNLDGHVNPEDVGKTIREIYDNSFVDYKKLIPAKPLINNKPNTNFNYGASNLTFINPDYWVYQNEKSENGGQIEDGLYASDPLTVGTVASF